MGRKPKQPHVEALPEPPRNDARAFLRSKFETPAGTPVESMGTVWFLADFVPELDPVWDRLYNDCMVRGSYVITDVMCAAHRLLSVNYLMEPDDEVEVIRSANVDQLAKAVIVALFGPDQVEHTWTDWVVASLAANGLRFADIPPDKVRVVLETLVTTGRAIPATKFISSAEYAATMGKMRRLIKPCPPGSPDSSPTSTDTNVPLTSPTTT